MASELPEQELMNDRREIPQNERIRLALLITELSPGGAEKAMVQLALGLDRARYSPVVYSLSGRAQDRERSLAPLLRERGIEVVELGLTGAKDLPRVFWRLRQLLKAQRAQILQSFMFHANILGRLAGRAAGVPVVCSGIRVAERDSYLRLAIDRLTSVASDVWVCVGESTAEFTRTVGRIPKNKVVSISNGVRTRIVDGKVCVVTSGDLTEQAERPAPYIPPEPFGKRKLAVAVGRLSPQKGFDWLLEYGLQSLPEDWELWIVGDGEERERLLDLRDKLGLRDRVCFTGWRPDASDLLANAELFVLSSRWEGTPNVLLESAALGKCALCTNVEGVAEVLGDAAGPQVCELNDNVAWNEKMARLVSDDVLREELGRRNQERVLKEFTVERVVERYDALWSRLLTREV